MADAKSEKWKLKCGVREDDSVELTIPSEGRVIWMCIIWE